MIINKSEKYIILAKYSFFSLSYESNAITDRY